MPEGEIIMYQPDGQPAFHLEVRIEDETVWLTQTQMVELFDATKQNISLHINNVFKEGELQEDATVKESLIVQKEVYLIGASLKDLGKKWFAFSRITLNVNEMLKRLQ